MKSAKRFAALVALACVAFAARAETHPPYPSRAVHILVPASPGGASDIAARILAPKLAEALGQPFVVENRMASGGIVATAQLARAAPDGYTTMMTFDTFVINPHVYQDVPYNVLRDFAPITLVARYVQVLLVHPSLGVRTLPEFVAHARRHGESLHFGTAGAGSSTRLAYELFREAAGIESVPVHYRGGGPAIQALIAGVVKVMLVQAGGPIHSSLRAGKLTALATSGRARSSYFPDVPAVAEFYPGFETFSWTGLVAPAGIPPQVAQTLNRALQAILSKPEVREQFAAQAADVAAIGGEQFAEVIRTESAKWARIVREKGIKVQ